MRNLRFRVIGILFFALVVGLPATAQDSSTLVIRAAGPTTVYNPLIRSDVSSSFAQRALFPLPMNIDPDTGLPVPGLTSWEQSEDGMVYTFTILPDAVWSDGTPITSADFKFSYDALKSPNVESVNSSAVRTFQEVRIVDDKTYEIVLATPTCDLFSDLASVPIVPAHRFQSDFSDVMENDHINVFPDISGGPYILEEVAQQEFLRFRANPTYWGNKPSIETVITRIIPDEVIALQALQAGEIDFLPLISAEAVRQIPNPESYTIVAYPSLAIGTLHLNFEDPNDLHPAFDDNGNPVEQSQNQFFSDVRVRQAIAMGYDKDAVLEGIGGERAGRRTNSLIYPSLAWAYDEALEPWQYDPEQAAALLDEAGWVLNPATGIRERDGVPFRFEVQYQQGRIEDETTVLVAQDQLSQLGIEVVPVALERGAFLTEYLVPHRFDAMVLRWTGAPPPTPSFLTNVMLLSAGDNPGATYNIQSYDNPEFDALIEQANTLAGCDLDARAELYAQAVKLAHDDVAIDFTFEFNNYMVAGPRVQGLADVGPFWSAITGLDALSLSQ